MVGAPLLRLLQFFHHALDQLFCIGQTLHDELDIHDWFARPALALAINTMLSDQGHGVRDRVHGDGQPSAWHAHHGFVVFQFFLLFVEYRHTAIVTVTMRGA